MGSLLQLSDVADHIPHEEADFFRSRVTDLLERRHTSFPGAQPVSFARKHLQELQRTEYDGRICVCSIALTDHVL